MSNTKVITHQPTTVTGSAPVNPPPYTPGPPRPYGPTVASIGPAVVPVVLVHQLGPNPVRVTCKSCSCEVDTVVQSDVTMRTHLFAALLCVLCCWPCVCLPYCMDSCMRIVHYCPNCRAYIGSYIT